MSTVLTVIAVLMVLGMFLYLRWTFRRLDGLLDAAMKGTYTPSRYDESRLSRFEEKLTRILSVNQLSRARIEEDRRRVRQTVADLSHQTKTPIASLKLCTELLQEQPLPSPDACALVEQISGQVTRLTFLIEGLVKTSRLEAGVIRPVPQRAAVSDLLTAVTEEYAPRAREAKIVLRREVPDAVNKMAFAWFDPKWTAEALGNLVDNAIKYTPASGTVTLRIRVYELFCRIDVTDTGIGIPEGEQAAIWGRFGRGTNVRQREGVGIGLYLTRQILSAEGGYVKAVSAAGKGSTFSVFLPRTEELCQNC